MYGIHDLVRDERHTAAMEMPMENVAQALGCAVAF
jgi:hypothetical protein